MRLWGWARAVSLLVDRTDQVRRVGAFVHRRCVLDGYADDGLAWVRVCGHGVAVVNTLFTRTAGLEERGRATALGPFRIHMLTPASRAPRLDATAARQLDALGRRHPEEASAFHGGRPLDDLSVEDLHEWCAALARGNELNEL